MRPWSVAEDASSAVAGVRGKDRKGTVTAPASRRRRLLFAAALARHRGVATPATVFGVGPSYSAEWAPGAVSEVPSLNK